MAESYEFLLPTDIGYRVFVPCWGVVKVIVGR